MVVSVVQPASGNPAEAHFEQVHREAKWAVGLTLLYLLMWVVLFCWADSELGISGLPRWFEWLGLWVPIVFTGLCGLMVVYIYRDLPLES